MRFPSGAGADTSRILRVVTLTLIGILMATCGTVPPSTVDQLDGNSWEMTSVREDDVLRSPHPTTIAVLTVSGGQVHGYTGCNHFRARVTASGDSMRIDEIALTGSACDPSHVDQGDAFVRALRSVSRYVVSDEQLVLADSAGTPQLEFRPADPLPLTGITWRLEWYGEGTAPLDGADISLVVRDDVTLIGVSGCNQYAADYTVDSSRIAIDNLVRTEMACSEPDGVMDQEADYLAVLHRAASYSTDLTDLELLDSDGIPIAEFVFGGRHRTG